MQSKRWTLEVQGEATGIGFRPELAADLLHDTACVDLVEVVAERLFSRRDAMREALALREIWPIAVHGVKLSLASATGIDDDRAARLGRLARELRAPFVTEHVALTEVGGRELGHLTAVPFHRQAVATVGRNVARARRFLPDVPFLLENVAWTLRWPSDEMTEGQFHTEIVRATGCPLLLDVANVYANARNSGVDPRVLLESYPLDAVAMIHVAGGRLDDGFWFDTHAHDLSAEVLELLAIAIAHCGAVPVVLERDDDFPEFAQTRRELETLRSMARKGLPKTPMVTDMDTDAQAPPSIRTDETSPGSEFAEQQAMAEALLGDEVGSFEARAIRRTRAVLRKKRLEDARAFLPRLFGACGDRVEQLARTMLGEAPRPGRHVAPSDALRIADALTDEPGLGDDARWDRLLLRARFRGPDARGELRSRAAPYVARERIGARTLWVWKGPGTAAKVHTWWGGSAT